MKIFSFSSKKKTEWSFLQRNAVFLYHARRVCARRNLINSWFWCCGPSYVDPCGEAIFKQNLVVQKGKDAIKETMREVYAKH